MSDWTRYPCPIHRGTDDHCTYCGWSRAAHGDTQ